MTTAMRPEPRTLPPRPPGMPGGSGVGPVRETRRYLDDTGRVRTAAIKVPVNEYGKPTSVRMRCTRCTPRDRWVPNAVAGRGDPMCDQHDRVMSKVPIPKAPVLPWSAIAECLKPYLWLWTIDKGADGRRRWEVSAGSPGWLALVALAGMGVAQDPTVATAPVWAVAGLGVGVFTARMIRRRLTNRAMAQGKLDADPEVGRKHRAAIASVFRTVVWGVTIAGCWVAVADLAGVDPRTLAGRIVWTCLPALWLPYAATYWRWVRRQRARRETPTVAAVPDADVIPLDPDEAWVRWRYTSTVAGEKGQPIPPPPLQVVTDTTERSA